MDAQQNEEKEAASAETLGQVNPISADMEANPPTIERVVDDLGLSEAHGLPVAVETKGPGEAIKEDPSLSEKDGPVDDTKVTPADTVEVAKACSPTEDAETHNVEAAISHEAVEACSHPPPFDNAEITLVVEVNTDTEMIDESGEKGEEIRQGEANTLVEPVTTLQVGEQAGALQYKEEGTGTSPAVIHEHPETSKTENLPQQRMGEVQTPDQRIGQNELAISDMHVEVETQTLEGVRVGFLSEDETKEIERKGEEGHVHAEAQIGEDAARSCIKEDAVTFTGELEGKAEGTLNVASGLSDAMEGVENNEVGRKGEEAVGGCMDTAVEADDTERGCMDMEVEVEANIRPCVNEVSAGIVDGEREKDGTAGQEPAGVERSHGIAEEMVDIVKEQESGSTKDDTAGQEPAGLERLHGIAKEMVDIVKEQESGSTKDDTAGQEPDVLERSHGIAKEMVDIVKEKESGSTTLQMELGANETSLENEAVQAGSMQISKGTDGVGEGMERAEATLISTEVLRNKEVLKVEEPGGWSNTPTEMDVDTIVSEKQRKNVDIFQHMEISSGERASKEMQEMHCETEADTSDIVPLQHHLDVEKGPVLGIKEDECHQLLLERNTENGKEVAREVSADHIALCSNKDTIKEVDSGQGGHLFGQDLQASPAIQGPLPNLKSKNIALQSSFSEGDRRVQRERQHNRQVHAEMQIRLLPDKSVQADLIKSHEVLEGSSGMRVLKESPFAKSKEAKDEELGSSVGQHLRVGIVMQVKAKADTTFVEERPKDTIMREVGFEENQRWAFEGTGYENTARGISRGARAGVFEEEKTGMSDEANTGTSEEEKYLRAGFEKGSNIEKAIQKRKLSDNLASDSGAMNELCQNDNVVKKAKKKAVNVWAKSTSRKGPKKNSKNGAPQNPTNEDSVLLTPVYVNPDKLEDGPDQPIALSKYDKAEKIELSENRLTASSTKGYRMVRATRGVQEGTWYFEIVVEQLGPTGHTRLGWSTQKGDVQAPVGFDSNSYGYRDLDGSKTHVAVREPYGDLYVEGDVIGFYIHLPNGAEYAPKPAPLLSYRGRPYLSDIKEEQPKKVPGSEICFFRNGVCQGTAFRDINAGRYFPAASMYTLPKEPSCIVRFNFGPEFRFPPVDIGDRPAPMAMVYAPYHNALNGKEAGPVAWANVSATGNASLNTEPQIKIV